MGRRKIEIQPITHERNRSVTFLKSWHLCLILISRHPVSVDDHHQRKNGLFKKAYELGVLCSVDVAVIIFEERPGHHLKLYQYGSSDIHDIVQRHIRHDGEKDTRGPADFSGATTHKIDEGDEDEDNVDDDEELPRNNKRRLDGKLKPSNDLVGSMDYAPSHRVPITQPPPLSMHGLGPNSATLPISGVRDNGNSKRSRLGSYQDHHSRSPSDDPSYYGHPSQNSAGAYGSTRSGGGYHSSSHHHGGGGQHQNYQQQYQPFLSHTSPPSSFMPLQPGPPSSRGGPGGGGGFGLPPQHRSSTSSTGSYGDPAGLYPGMVGRGSGGGGGPGGAGGGGAPPDLFGTFLDADEHSRQQGQAQQNFGLDWPVHGPGSGGPSGASSSVSNPSQASSAGPDPTSQTPSNGNWLDFLSGNGNNPNASNPASAAGRQHSESMSWERGGGPGGAGSPMVSGMGKRSPPVGSLLGSPLTANGRDAKDGVLKEVGAG